MLRKANSSAAMGILAILGALVFGYMFLKVIFLLG